MREEKARLDDAGDGHGPRQQARAVVALMVAFTEDAGMLLPRAPTCPCSSCAWNGVGMQLAWVLTGAGGWSEGYRKETLSSLLGQTSEQPLLLACKQTFQKHCEEMATKVQQH